MVEGVGELELGDDLPEGKFQESRDCVDPDGDGALAALILSLGLGHIQRRRFF